MPPKWMPFSKDFLILSVKPIFCWNLMPPKPMPFMSKMLSTLNLFCLTQCPQNGCLYERCSQCEASSFKAKCPRNGCLQQRLFNSQRETYFLLKPDAPKANAFHVKDVVNIEPFLFWHNAPKMDAFMKDGLNVKPVLLKQNAPDMDAFQQRLFNSQRETYFLLKPDAPKTNAFHVKDVVNIEPFLFDTMPLKSMMADVLNVNPLFRSSKFWKRRSELWKPFWQRHSACKMLACLVKLKAPRNELVPCFLGWRLFHGALAVYPDPAKSFRNAASAWRYGTYFGPPFRTHNR